MRYKKSFFQTILIVTWISVSHGCQMEGVATWFTPVTATVLDTHSGSFFNRATTNIVGINSITYGEGLNSGPYLQVTHENSVFDITTNDEYPSYEENETSLSMTFTVVFGCAGGSTSTLVFIINVIDTNNNSPQFLPNTQFEFTITPPLPPGYQITGCLQDITVRDIDLTTQRIDFAIEQNEYFEIDYDASLSADPKEFKAVLRTTTVIRSLSEAVELTISATDVDLTGDPPITTSATIRIMPDSDFQFPEEPVFSKPFYLARYSDNQVTLDEPITLQEGFHDLVQFTLEGENSSYFEILINGSQLSLGVIEPLSPALLSQGQLMLAVRAEREFTSGATTAVVMQLPEVLGLRFENTLYEGRIVDDTMEPLQLILDQGYESGFSVDVTSNFSAHFTTAEQDNIITLSFSASPNPIEQNFISIQVSASNDFSTASAVVTLEVIRDDVTTPTFEKAIYNGGYTLQTGLTLEQINLIQGYDETVSFSLEGEHALYFEVTQNNPVVSIIALPLPVQVLMEEYLILTLRATKPRTVGANSAIYIDLPSDDGTTPGASFERALYKGVIQDGRVQHEAITLSGYNEPEIPVFGTYAELFEASVADGSVTVQGVSSVTLAPDVRYVALELRAFAASAVLLLDIEYEDTNMPSVTFGSTTYSIRIDISQTGFLGRVEATASNGEAVSYSLLTQDDYLSQRVSVNQEGELHLSTAANSGVYSFEVVATTVITNVSGSAVVQLTVDFIAECGGDKIVPPLIILDRDEEEPHRNLVIISEEHAGCRYSLTNRWPVDQTWLYVDDIGLHANSIDREDASIAFMALSQIQVELLLECDSDITNNIARRSKRSVNPRTSLKDLGPYDYGNKSWILTDSILYNSRRTLVNLIVNDINDNYPIFVGKDKEPIPVGYPIPELEEKVSPRALIQIQATDADVGENAALVYWSSDEVLAVSPSSGLVHVRQNARLEDGVTLSVFATDQNGQGLTGNLTLMVKLLDLTNIAVVTIRDAFLEDEQAILENVSTTVGYEVKSLRATVVSDDSINNENTSRKKREVTTFGASLQLYVYGLIETEPVLVDRLTTDLTNDRITTVTITRTVSLEDHLEEMRESSGRDTGLLVATVVLSVLLFILIVLVAVWFFLKWRKERIYEKFKDETSIASLDESGENAKQKEVMPRLNIEELKKSERRLQERLEAPDVTVKSNSSKPEPSSANTEFVTVPTGTSASIVIHDKLKNYGDESDDEGEYGEKKNSRRKSVVTFNENVEKIIHVENSTVSDDDSSIHDLEVYKL